MKGWKLTLGVTVLEWLTDAKIPPQEAWLPTPASLYWKVLWGGVGGSKRHLICVDRASDKKQILLSKFSYRS